jgi:anthranilate synthase/aminodeoxychorismate synthase-like glutamine amidotransferase
MATKILVVDNYDSFVFNLVQYLGQLGAECTVVRNDEITADEASKYDGVLISPGPGTPEKAGVSIEMINYCAKKEIPLFGVCLGHQAIGEAFGGDVIRAKKVMHGKVDTVHSKRRGVFQGLPASFQVTRYHSLAISKETLPACLEVTAVTDDDEIMGVRHKTMAVEGVQFHPESILSEYGHELLHNFLKIKN